VNIGIMNNPARPLSDEIDFAIRENFDFLDLTFEPPCAMIEKDDVQKILALTDGNIDLIGHTAWYLPVDSPYPSVQKTVCEELIRQFIIFAQLGVSKVTIHFKFSFPSRFMKYNQKLIIWENALNSLMPACNDLGITLMLENTINTNEALNLTRTLLAKFKELAFHLDVGHCNLFVPGNTTSEYLKYFSQRLVHVHLSDNFGGNNDLHLPIGTGNIPWGKIINLLKKAGYDDTITLEVFSQERSYLLRSREILRTLWDSGD